MSSHKTLTAVAIAAALGGAAIFAAPGDAIAQERVRINMASTSIGLMAIIIFDVITRRFLVLGSTKLQEMEWHLHGALFLMTFGFAYLKDAHVRIELLRDRFSIRTRAWVEIVGILLCVIPYSALIVWYGIGLVERSFVQGEISSALTGLPFRWIIKAFVPLGFFVLLIGGVSLLLRCLVCLFGPPEWRDEAGRYLAPPHTPAASN